MAKQRHPLMRVFVRGLAIVLPLVLTLFLLAWLWNLLDKHLVDRVEAAVVAIASWLGYDFAPEPSLTMGISIVAVFVVILFAGWWLSGFFGRRIYAAFDRLLHKTPVISAVYPHVKQITEFFLGTDAQVEFERVVAVPYPRLGVYSLAFLTGNSLESLNQATGKELISVYIPSSPMPVTGYTLFLPAEELIPVDLTVEEALRTVISGGVIVQENSKSDRIENPDDA